MKHLLPLALAAALGVVAVGPAHGADAPADTSTAAVVTPPPTLPSPSTEPAPEMSIPWLDPEGFLPERHPGEDAVALYAQAAESMRQTPGFPAFPRQPNVMEEEPHLREALRLAYEASQIEEADFLSTFSYRAWEDGGTPDLLAAMVIGQGMTLSARGFLEAGDPDGAERTAKAALGMGDHYLRGAPNLVQALIGERILEEGMRALVAVYRKQGRDEEARRAAERIAAARDVEMSMKLKCAAEMVREWGKLGPALSTLQDKDPLIRSDALLFIESCYDPQGRKRLLEDPETLTIAGVVLSDPKAVLQAVLKLENDPNSVARRLAKRAAAAVRGNAEEGAKTGGN